jgi:hypothetical protein
MLIVQYLNQKLAPVMNIKVITHLALTALAMVLFETSTRAQANDLKAQGSALQNAVVAVQSGSKTYEQKTSFQEPAVIRHSYDEIDQKGNRTNYVYEFNLADIDPYAVREQTQKDLISVVVAVRNKQKLIKVYKNEVVQPYDAQTSIIAKDIENARAISDIIKKAIPAAEKVMASRLKLSGYDPMVAWLLSNVRDISLGEKSIKQSLKKGDHPGSLALTRVEADAKSSTEEVFTFNLADINANAIVYKITGNQFAISFEALQEAKYFSVKKNGAAKPYVNELVIHTNNADEARDLKSVLSTSVPLAAEKIRASMPPVGSEKDGVQKVKSLTTDITIGDKTVSQSWDGDCLTTFTQVEKDPKSSTKNVFKFNWMDVNPLASKIDVSGDRMAVDLNFNEDKKLVMNSVDEKFKGYNNDVKIYMADIEAARKAKFVIDKVVEKCKASFKEPFGADAVSTTGYFRNNIKEISVDEMTVKQTVEPVEGDKNKYKYTLIEVNPKGASAEQVYEFNLSDMNPTSVAVDVKGKWLYVTMETDFKGKIIKYYKDGKIQPYTSTLQFAVNDVDIARNLVSALNKAVKALKAK